MFDHVGITVADYRRSIAFYDKALAAINVGVEATVTAEETGGAYEGIAFGRDGKASFWISGSGTNRPSGPLHLAFAVADRLSVDRFYQAAIAAGGKDNGPPGIRSHYHPNYYGAFVLDPDGNNVEVVCHLPE